MQNRLFIVCAVAAGLLASCGKPSGRQQSATDDSSAATSSVDGSGAEPIAFVSSSTTGHETTISCIFGFTNRSGSYVLTSKLGTVPAPGEMLAFSGDQQPSTVSFLEAQEGSSIDNGRQTAANFDNTEGLLFHVNQQNLDADQTVLLVSKRFLRSRTPLNVSSVIPPTPLDPSGLAAIEQAKRLKAKRGWHIANLSADRAVALVEFYPQGDTALLSLVLVDHAAFVFEDHPGKVSDESSVWRADDGGEIDPESFKIIAAFDSAGVLFLARTWAGPEGEDAVLLQEKRTRFNKLMESYRYWSPE